MTDFIDTNDTIGLFDNIELIGSHWNCSIQGLNEKSDTITVILKRELIMPKDIPEEQRIKCVYTFNNISKDEEELINRFKRVIRNFEEIGGKVLVDTLKDGICKAAQKEVEKCRAKG